MRDNFQEALGALKNLETPESPTDKTDETNNTIHNTSSSLREAPEVFEMPKPLTDKTDKTTSGYKAKGENLQTCKRPTAKTDKTPDGYEDEAWALGLIASWSHHFGYVSLHDPATGEWWDVQTKDAPGWALNEARKRKELYRDGNRRAYRLTSREIEEIWEAGQPPEEGLVEEHPIEKEDNE